MVTVRETKKIVCDVKRFIAGMSPYSNPNVRWLKTTSANIKPGMGVIRGTGAGGEATATEAGSSSAMVYAIAEFDPKQIANNGIAYGSGDLIPVLPLHLNLGVEMRNIRIDDASANVPADTPMCVSGTIDGEWMIAVEADLADASGDAFDLAVNQVVGVNGVAGSTIHNRVFLRSLYYYVDEEPGPLLICAYVVAC